MPTQAPVCPELAFSVYSPLALVPPMFDWISRSLWVTCTNSIPEAVRQLPFVVSKVESRVRIRHRALPLEQQPQHPRHRRIFRLLEQARIKTKGNQK